MNEKINLYILGAGASNPDGVPVTSELIDQAFWNFGGKYDNKDMFLMGTWDKETEVLSIVKPVLELYDKFYGTDLTEKLKNYYRDGYHPVTLGISTNRIEDFFSRLYYLSKGIENYNLSLTKQEILDLSRKANYLFFHTLAHSTIGISKPKYYSTFVEKLLKRNGKHCIISFNYDLLLEDVSTSRDYLKYDGYKWLYPEELKWSYCINFKNVSGVPYDFPEEKRARILYLKLHGSLNWSFCPLTQEVSMHTLHADAWIYKRFYNEELRCHNGSHVNLPLLIPPIKNKEIDNSELKSLWGKAYNLVSQAKEIHIIGYSSPEVDIEANKLLGQPPIDMLEKIVIVNPNKDHINKFIKILQNESKILVFDNFQQYLINYK